MATSLYTSFVGRDYTTRLQAIMEAIRVEVPGLTDLNYSGIANVLSRLLASESDFLALYQDEAYSETAIDYALFKQSLLDMAKTVDEKGILPSSARGFLTATKLSTASNRSYSISKYTEFSRGIDSLSYLAAEDIYFPSSDLTCQIPVIQGTIQTITIAQSDFELSDITNRRTYNLGENVCANSVTVTSGVSPSIAWTEVDSFWESTNTDNHFVVYLEADGPNETSDVAVLTLGDGTKGINTFVGDMTVTFIRTDGELGNCAAGQINTAPMGYLDDFTVTNELPLRGGAGAESLESVRWRVPAATRIQRRGLTSVDYAALVLDNIPGILYCQAADRSVTHISPHLYTTLYVVPAGGGPMSDALKTEIQLLMQEKGHLGQWDDRYIILDATQVLVDVSCSIGVSPGYNSSSVISQVIAKCNEALSVDNQRIGGTLSFDELFTSIVNLAGVRSVTITEPSGDVVAGVGEMLVIGNVSVTTKS